MKKMMLLVVVAVLSCGFLMNSYKALADQGGATASAVANASAKGIVRGEVKEMFIQHNLRQGPCFKLTVSARYLVKGGKEIGRDVAAKRARIALEGLKKWGWIAQFRGIESSTKRFIIEVDVTAMALADQSPPTMITRVYVFKPGHVLAATRNVENCGNTSNYQESLGMAVEQAQLEADTEGKEVWTTSSATCPSAGE
jgi:hypothetical protein